MNDIGNIGPFHCPDCGSGYSGYHRCDEGADRVVHVCTDCGEIVNRTVSEVDLVGVAPVRCGSCTLDAMTQTLEGGRDD